MVIDACGACGDVSIRSIRSRSIKAKKGLHTRLPTISACSSLYATSQSTGSQLIKGWINFSMVITSEAWHLSLPSRQSWTTLHDDTTKRDKHGAMWRRFEVLLTGLFFPTDTARLYRRGGALWPSHVDDPVRLDFCWLSIQPIISRSAVCVCVWLMALL